MAAAAVSSWVPEDHFKSRLGIPTPSAYQPSPVLPAATLAPATDDSSIKAAVEEHDPHHLPTFGSTTLTAPTAPILYLPPLLSSLPPGYAQPPEHTSNYRPLTTDTRLPDIDPVSLMLHKALHKFQPTTTEYSVIPYEEAFNWSELHLPEDSEREWYCVVFRSKRKEGSDGGREFFSRAFS